jgi:hypothetical protein
MLYSVIPPFYQRNDKNLTIKNRYFFLEKIALEQIEEMISK